MGAGISIDPFNKNSQNPFLIKNYGCGLRMKFLFQHVLVSKSVILSQLSPIIGNNSNYSESLISSVIFSIPAFAPSNITLIIFA